MNGNLSRERPAHLRWPRHILSLCVALSCVHCTEESAQSDDTTNAAPDPSSQTDDVVEPSDVGVGVGASATGDGSGDDREAETADDSEGAPETSTDSEPDGPDDPNDPDDPDDPDGPNDPGDRPDDGSSDDAISDDALPDDTSAEDDSSLDDDTAVDAGVPDDDSQNSDDASNPQDSGLDNDAVAGDSCQFVVDYTQSSAISTVTIVTWSTDLDELDEAHIEFGLADADFTMTAPVDLTKPDYRTLLLGMKTDRDYRFRVVATRATETCTSPTFDVRTGSLPMEPPVIEKNTEQAGGAQGFFITTPGLSISLVGVAYPGAFIFDSDGDIVWWAPVAEGSGQGGARMSYDGEHMWYVSATQPDLFRTSMDGLEHETIGGLVANHDLTPLPEGGVATIDSNRALVEVKDDGTITDIAVFEDLYETNNNHANAVTYHASSNTFIISDLRLNGFVRITRAGELLWQLGGSNPKGNFFELLGFEPWVANHGHQLGPDGQFLFYNNGADVTRIVELQLDEDNWTATKTWEHELNGRANFLGNVQRLANGNTIITSFWGEVLEVTPSKEVVQRFEARTQDGDLASFGYARFRESLYGPPSDNWAN